MRILLAASLVAVALAGCLDDELPIEESDEPAIPAGSHPAYGFPVYLSPRDGIDHGFDRPDGRDLPASLSGLEQVAEATGTSGAGIAVFGRYVYAGASGGPTDIIDIKDPLAPMVVGSVEVPGRDLDTIVFPDGRIILVGTAGGNEMTVADVTDPANAHIVAAIQGPSGAHNLAVVPGTPILYDSPSTGEDTDIFDLSDPANPVLVKTWRNGAGCHDITFYNDAERGLLRAYCAGLDVTQIWDTTDPKDPQILVEMPFPPETHAQAAISHTAMVNDDASVLIVGDEIFGDCTLETQGDSIPIVGPTLAGEKRINLWFYDLSDETAPVLHGHISPAADDGACTSHFGKVIEDTDHFVMGFYGAGVLLIDFQDIDAPRVVDQYAPPGGSAWDAWYYQGYVFTDGGTGGVSVLRIV